MTHRFQSWLRRVVGLSVPDDVRSGGIALADQVVASATNFLTGVVIGRTCSKEEFGLYLLGLSIVLFAMRLQTAFIATPFMVYSPRLSGNDDARYTGSTLVHQVGISLVATSSLVMAEVGIAMGIGPRSLLPVIRALMFTIGLILLRDFVRHVCFARLRFTAAFILDVGASFVQLSCLLFLARSDRLSAEHAFWAIGLSCGLGGLIWLVHARGTITINLRQSIADLKGNWSFGRWIFASGFLWELTVILYPWILASFKGTTATGVWAACYGAVAIGNPVLLGMGNYLGPRMAHSYAEGGGSALRSMVWNSGVIFSLLILPFSLMFLFWGGTLVEVLYGEKYGGQSVVVSLLALDLLISPVRFGLSRALFAMGNAHADFITNFMPLLVLLVLGIWLVRGLGPAGVAVGLLTGNIAVVAAKYYAYGRCAPENVLVERQ